LQAELEQSKVLSCSELCRTADNYVINVIWYKQSQKVRCELSTVIIIPIKPYSVSLQLLSGLSQETMKDYHVLAQHPA